MIKKVFNDKQLMLLAFLGFILSITSIAFTYGAFNSANLVDTVSKGIINDTLYVNDLESDYYYYTGMNYTNSNNGTLPSLVDKNLYNDSNLVKTTITYSGTSYDGNHTGYVSLTELQSKFVYYKYYPVIDGYIEIELIDNPFANHPKDLAFNGWLTNYEGASISYDSDYYTRTVRVPVTYSNSKVNNINITMYASWTNATVSYVNSSTSFNEAQNDLKNEGMNEIETVKYIYDNPSVDGYYKKEIITTTATKSSWGSRPSITYGTCTDCYDDNANYFGINNNYSCPAPSFSFFETGTKTNDCNTYYLQDENDTYDINAIYYELRNGRFIEADLKPEIIGTEPNDLFNEDSNMSGYYKTVDVSYNQSINGYYDNLGNALNGVCTNRGGCTYYELIQFYNNGIEEKLDPNTKYYYLTTRDTNILVMNGNRSDSWSSYSTKPFTLTGIYNGIDYNPTWTVSNTSVICYADTRIENLTIATRTRYSNSNPSNSSSASATFYGNYFNVKIGRNIKQSDSYVNFNSLLGAMNSSSWGGSTVGSSSNPKKYSFVVESGYYNSLSLTFGASTGSTGTQLYTEMYGVYGNDYDRATLNNDNLVIYFCASGSWSGRIHSSNDDVTSALNTIVKSGSFGTSKDDLTTGIYVGGRYGGTHYAPRSGKVEGGYIYNLIGGPLTDSSNGGTNDTYIYMTGGSVDAITGGAGTTTTYGNRILQLTGGTVNYSVFGGSNGYDGSSSDGTLTGDSYVYIGGNVVIGNDSYINSNATIWGAEAGSVFGAGNGNTRYATIGSVNNSNIVINDEATIKRNVYGSGNYGTVGYSSSNSNSDTSIKVVGGTVNGSIFGSGNHSGSGRSGRVSSNIDIEMTGGVILDSIYGGSNQEGTVYGDVSINLINGSLKDSYGGGLGEDTYVSNNVNVVVGSNLTTDLLVNGSIYGGSAYGVVNSTNKNTTRTNYTTDVLVNNGKINNVFGGGKGNNSITPYVGGNVLVTVNGGEITNLYGGNDAKGQPNGDVTVTLNDGIITNAYGGGNNTLVSTTTVYQKGALVTNLYGGSNASGDVVTSNISVTGGVTKTLYGGNNIGGSTSNTNITVTGGEVTTLYGGGALTDTNLSTISINNGNIGTIYGGGEKASILDSSNITVTAGDISYLYGGSNILGNVKESNILINGGSLLEVYGGNNQGGITSITNLDLNSGEITTCYGGGNRTTTTTSNVKLNGSSIDSVYGGGNNAGVNTSNVSLISGTISNVFGGSNFTGTVDSSNIKTSNVNNLLVTNIYGGNNQGGSTKNANINLDGGSYTNIYGGGNMASTDTTKVLVDGVIITGQFYGGGNRAAVNNNTSVNFKNSTIDGDIFGGGNLGEVLDSTSVYISNSHIGGSVYAGGNGVSAIVSSNTLLNIDNNSIIENHVFGGGNAANTGNEDNNNSLSEVNIKGATIKKNVYGGANTAVLYGEVSLNIGNDVTPSSLVKSDINILGTVFGGGEANASGDLNYDYSFISVTKGINIKIDGANHNNFSISGSIFGSGNASSTSGYSYIDIDNYGTFTDYKDNISIQRADIVTIKNSNIKLAGTTDRTNEFSKVKFSISRVKELKLANDSTLFLENGTNLLEKFYSLKINGDKEEKATVTIDSNGNVSRNVNNRVYMYEGKNLNIATNEAVTTYGEVSGMTFFGMYQLDRNDRVVTAFYDKKYDASSLVAPGEFYTFTSGSYALGLHYNNHDITKDGFYSNYEDEDNPNTIRVKYIEPTPSDASYYMWSIGETVTTYEFTLTASKYSTLGTYELPLVTSSAANTSYEIIGFNYQNLESDFNLVSKDEIDRVNTDGSADNKMSLVMEPADSGFVTVGETTFMTNDDTPISGTSSYKAENSATVSSFIFYLYHSKNLTLDREIGTAVISLLAITPIDDLNNEVTRINVNVTLNTALYNTIDYEGAMTPGKEYNLFASTPTNITDKSSFSAYYSLYMENDEPYYKDSYYHALVSTYVLPLNTKITMIDLANKANPTYYYYVINEEDVANATNEFNLYGEATYLLSKFIAMGSTSSNNNYDEVTNMNNYYDRELGITEEEFIFMVDFEDTSIDSNQLNNKLLMELRNDDDQTLISVLGVQHANLTYNLYDNQNALLDISGNLSNSKLYLGDSVDLSLTTDFLQPEIDSVKIIDTTYYEKRSGVKISIYDANGNKLNNSSILGINYELDGITYYPRMDGSVRIPLADRVANLYNKIKINTKNTNLASGDYTLRIESFGSYDGIYYGPKSSDTLDIPFTIVNSRYGLKVTLPDSSVIINKDTGMTSSNNNALVFNILYESNLSNPNIRLTLYRRNYDDVYDLNHTEVNLLDYITNNLTQISENTYLLEDNPTSTMDKFIYLKDNLQSGTYKFVFSLYDDDIYIGDVSKYVIIK